MKSKYSCSAAAVLVASVLAASAASAQEAPKDGGSTAPTEAARNRTDDTLSGDIVVTAQKRAENVQDIPAAITALGGAALQDRGVARFDDLQTVSPALTISTSGPTQSVNIRGIGLASGNASATNGVATYIDGMFQPPIVSTNSFFDIASVEVFRGPQGTFVGSNSTGGAIFINSNNPRSDLVKGYGQLTYGSYNRVALEGAVNLPISSTLSARVAGFYTKRDSYYTNSPGLKSHPGSLDETAGRFGLSWKPSSSFSALLKVEYNTKGTEGYAWRPLPLSPNAPYAGPDPFRLNYDTETRDDERSFQATLKLDYITAGGVDIRSVSGFTRKRVFLLHDLDATNVTAPILPSRGQQWYINENEETQELNVISPDDQRVKWVVGGYFQRNNPYVFITVFQNSNPLVDVLLNPVKIVKGLFGQVTVPIGSQFTIQAGARESWYKVDANGYTALSFNGLRIADNGGHERDSKLTGKIDLDWKPNDDNLVYAFVARGYKAGGYQTATTNFLPETVIDYEVGWKSAFFDRAVRTQISGFYYDYNNFQLDAISRVNGLNAVFNIGKATIKGIEGQVQVNRGGWLFDGSIAYVDSRLNPNSAVIDIRSYSGPANLPQCTSPGVPTGCVDYTPYLINTSSGPNLYSPKFSGNASLGYRLKTGDFAIVPRINFSYVGSQFTYIAYNPIRDKIGSRGLLGVSVDVDYKSFQLQLFATNLTNETYVVGQTSANQFYGAPREFGARLRAAF